MLKFCHQTDATLHIPERPFMAMASQVCLMPSRWLPENAGLCAVKQVLGNAMGLALRMKSQGIHAAAAVLRRASVNPILQTR
jgi:hypothetical protein